MKYRKAIVAILVAIILLIIFLIVFLFGYFMDGTNKTEEVYSWKEFENLTAEQQMEFQNSFETQEDFEKWMEEAQNVKIPIPWEDGGKAPSEYNWEEFEELTADQQMEFQNSFDKPEEFEEWLDSAQQPEIELPWESDDKEPDEYTWEEFEALTGEQQMIFQNSFEKTEDFEKWMDSVTDKEEAEVSFKKDDLFSVTWEEFETMSMEEQMIFQNSFKDINEFDKWLKANEPK